MGHDGLDAGRGLLKKFALDADGADLSAVSLLLNLEAAQQGRSMLFLDEQKLLFEGKKKGFAYTPNWSL
jgi:hypothetical protein